MKSSWRDQLLDELMIPINKLTLVSDPDNLLLEEIMLQRISEIGYELLSFEDPIAFRFIYESKFRSFWDNGKQPEPIVIVRLDKNNLNTLPYDLLSIGRRLAFSLGDLFPNFSSPIVASLDRSYLDDLYEAQQQHSPGVMSDNATKDFILRHVFKIAPELIKQSSDLLQVLLRKHFHSHHIPLCLDKRLIQILSQNNIFKDWPLVDIVSNRNSFFAFLQERWVPFLDYMAESSGNIVCETISDYDLRYTGPIYIPFDHDDVRVYIDSLFIEGLLQPVEHKNADKISKTWAFAGVKVDPEADRRRRLEEFINKIEAKIPTMESRHNDWLEFAYVWAELVVLISETSGLPDDISQMFRNLQDKLDYTFLTWCQKYFSGLHNLPSNPPVMVHHIPKSLARRLDTETPSKIAMIVIDGLSVDQWLVLRKSLENQNPELRFYEKAIFAWIPTITSVSRQALFSGKTPFYFPSSIYSTDKDSPLWMQFWLDLGLNQSQISHYLFVGDNDIESISDILDADKAKVIGITIDKVDNIMHGMKLGTSGMHNQVRQWTEQGHLAKLFTILHDLNYNIWLASDHGNIEASGIGSPSEGSTADIRGQRVRIYPSEIMRNQIKQKYLDAIEWPPYGLPDDYFPLFAPNRCAFVTKGKRIVTHGGISIEEVIVPFIEVTLR